MAILHGFVGKTFKAVNAAIDRLAAAEVNALKISAGDPRCSVTAFGEFPRNWRWCEVQGTEYGVLQDVVTDRERGVRT